MLYEFTELYFNNYCNNHNINPVTTLLVLLFNYVFSFPLQIMELGEAHTYACANPRIQRDRQKDRQTHTQTYIHTPTCTHIYTYISQSSCVFLS